METNKIFISREPGDFTYNGFLCWYYDMPNYKGYEVFENEESEEMIGRFHTRVECRKAIDKIIKNKTI